MTEKKKEQLPIDPWHTFMSAVTKTKLPVFVCVYYDHNGELQIKANGKIISLVGALSSATEFFKTQMFKKWEAISASMDQAKE